MAEKEGSDDEAPLRRKEYEKELRRLQAETMPEIAKSSGCDEERRICTIKRESTEK